MWEVVCATGPGDSVLSSVPQGGHAWRGCLRKEQSERKGGPLGCRTRLTHQQREQTIPRSVTLWLVLWRAQPRQQHHHACGGARDEHKGGERHEKTSRVDAATDGCRTRWTHSESGHDWATQGGKCILYVLVCLRHGGE